MLGLEATNAIPRLRTIRGAAKDIKSNKSELGIGEEQMRAAVDDERIDFIRIGNRAYIALELFEEPYIQHFTQIRFEPSADGKRTAVPWRRLDFLYPIRKAFPP